MMDQNTCFAYLNMELPDDIRRLKEAGYYDAAIARIDALSLIHISEPTRH